MGLIGKDLLDALDIAREEGRSDDVKLLIELANFRYKQRRQQQAEAVFLCPKPIDMRNIEIDG